MTLAAAAVASLSVAAIAGQAPVAKTVKGGESGLVGIKLYDTGTRVVSVYGNPTEIQAVGFGGAGIGPTGGAGGPGGRAGGGGDLGGGRPGGGFGGRGGTPSDAFNGPDFGFGDDILLQGPSAPPPPPGAGMGQGGPGMPPPPPSGSGAPGGLGGRGGPAGAGGGGAMGGGTGNKILYTRWIYKRGPSKYGFILDKFNRVVQVEAIGMNDGKVRTSKGIKFGSTFAEIQKKYQTPDGYEINGDNIVMRYLVRNKVAFRLSRLGDKKPHVVTGIVVAGGKT